MKYLEIELIPRFPKIEKEIRPCDKCKDPMDVDKGGKKKICEKCKDIRREKWYKKNIKRIHRQQKLYRKRKRAMIKAGELTN